MRESGAHREREDQARSNVQAASAEPERRNARARRQSRRGWWLTIGVVVVVGVALVVAVAANRSGDSDGSNALAPAAARGEGDVRAAIGGHPGGRRFGEASHQDRAPPLTSDGKPLVVYIGAEYCPFCAAERWPMVVALSRFGTFSGLQIDHRRAPTSTRTRRPSRSTAPATRSHYLAFQGSRRDQRARRQRLRAARHARRRDTAADRHLRRPALRRELLAGRSRSSTSRASTCVGRLLQP